MDANGCCPSAAPPVVHHHVAQESCSGGKQTSADTSGHCCWPGQVWGSGKCVGIPTYCPAGLTLNAGGQTCDLNACDKGLTRANDALHCCWPNQAWSTTRSVCVGVPKCPAGFERLGVESCGSLDRDGDGIPNAVDQCPDQAEDFNHYKDEDGCPDEAERLQLVAAAAAASQAAANAQFAEQQRAAAAVQRQQDEARQRAAAAEAARQKEADDAAAEQQRVARAAFENEEVSRRHRRTGGKVAIGLGGGSVGISLFAIALSAAQNSAVKNGHFATVQALESSDSTGTTENSVALATGIVGLVGVAGGMALIFASPEQAPFGSGPKTGLVITPTLGGLGVGGRF